MSEVVFDTYGKILEELVIVKVFYAKLIFGKYIGLD